MTWITVILTPMLIVFDLMDNLVTEDKRANLSDRWLWLVWVNDISWCVEIVLNFFLASPKKRNCRAIACSYFKGYFIFDVLATVPPMLFLQKSKEVNFLKFLRLAHIRDMFRPFKSLIDCLMS